MGGAPMGGVDNEIPPLGGEEGAIPPEGTGEEGSIPPPIAGLPNQTPNELPPIKESSRGNMDDESYNKFVNKLVYGDNHKENSIKQETSRLIMETESDILKFNNKALNLINEIENMVGDDLSENDKSIEEIIEEEPEINLNELNLEEEN